MRKEMTWKGSRKTKKKKEGLMLKKKFFGLLDVQLVEGEKR